jgi:hypothetical protein
MPPQNERVFYFKKVPTWQVFIELSPKFTKRMMEFA